MGKQSRQSNRSVSSSIRTHNSIAQTTSQQLDQVTKSFLNATMPQVVTSSYLISFTWVAFYLCFVTILAIQAFMTLKDYYSHPVNVEVTIETSSNSLEFPAVTLCNNNIVKKSSISRIPKYKELASLSEFVYQEIIPEANRNKEKLRQLGLHQCENPSSMWIPRSWVCNWKQDCWDGSDEDIQMCRWHQPLNYSEDCLDGFKKCPGESTCAVLCDGINDCVVEAGYDESEEQGCPPSHSVFHFTAMPFPQVLTSPNFPNIYPNNLENTYVIEASEESFIEIAFSYFNVEECDPNSCWCDFLTIQEYDTEHGKYFKFNGLPKMCGAICAVLPIQSSTSRIRVTFFSDYGNSLNGWSFAFKAIPKTEKRSPNFYEVLHMRGASCDNIKPLLQPSETHYESIYVPPEPMDVYSIGYDRVLYPDHIGGNPGEYVLPSPMFISGDIFETKKTDNYDWYSVYKSSKMPDFSDFTKFLKFRQEEIVGNGHQNEDFVVQCVFDGGICDAGWFHTFQHASFGNCFTFNSGIIHRGQNFSYGNTLKTSKVGSENGLALSLFLENNEYLGVIGQKSGVNVVLHNSDEHPPLLSKSILIGAGTATRVTVQQQVVFRESDPFSDCVHDWPEFLELSESYKKYRYTLEFCTYLCKQKTMAEVCGCTDSFDWNFSANEEMKKLAKQDCDVWNTTQYECMVSIYIDYYEGRRLCECPSQCSDKLFKSTISSASWPSEAYSPHFASLMKESTSKKVKKFMNQILANATLEERATANLNEQMKQNFARLEISFESMAFEKITEKPKYSLSILFGTIGGNLGLWLGWSILSLLELLQWVGMAILLFIMKCGKRERFTSSTRSAEDPYA